MRIDKGRRDIMKEIYGRIEKYNKGGVSAYLEINPNNLN